MIFGAALVAVALAVVQVHAVGAQTVQVPAAQPGVVVQPGTTVIVPGPAVVAPAPMVVAPAPVVVAPSASPATVTVITTTAAARFCGGAYRPDMGTNFGGC
jgi:hypothetical protein